MNAFGRCGLKILIGTWIGLGGVLATPAQATHVEYSFVTEAYDTVFDHYMTETRYTKDMHIEMSITIDAPLAPGLGGVPISPTTWSYADGIFAERGEDSSRIQGWVSTDSDGNLTDYLIQILLDAPHTPGVWVRRNSSGTAYATAIAREVVMGYSDADCAGPCLDDVVPIIEWAQDRATGKGDIIVSSFIDAGTANTRPTAPPEPPLVSNPLPAPAILLGAAFGALGVAGLRRSRPG